MASQGDLGGAVTALKAQISAQPAPTSGARGPGAALAILEAEIALTRAARARPVRGGSSIDGERK